ncbi:MAG: hypothetical protein J2O47_03855 [Acidimicrobiaceae bacterium]|nr:hypothetical protein [Acidimicrobiaceae bacterium]
MKHVLGLLATTTSTIPAGSGNGGPSWFAREEGFMLGLMGLVILPMLLVATIAAIARQDLSRLGRTWFVALPFSIVSALVGVEVTRGALEVTDSLSSAVLSTVNVSKLIGHALSAIVAHDAGNIAGGSVAILLIASLAIVAGVLLWLELVVRSAAIYVALLFLPLALSGLVWPSTSHMARRLVQTLVALVLSKFVVAAVLALGARAVSGGGGEGALAGVAILLLAGFAPFALLRMTPVVEAAAVAHLEGLSRRPFDGGRRSLALAATGVNLVPEPIRAALGFNASRRDPSVLPSPVGAGAVGSQHGEYTPADGDIGPVDPSLRRPAGGGAGWGAPAATGSTVGPAGAADHAGGRTSNGNLTTAGRTPAPGGDGVTGEDR